MNERMKIIVKKAHEYADQHWREDGYPFFEEYHQVFSNNYQQKFAELIVKDITAGQRELAKILSDTGSEDQAYILRITASNIERKFGVEE